MTDWEEHKKLVLSTQERHEELIEVVRKEVKEGFVTIREDVAGLKVKSGAWGAVSGAVVAAAAALVSFARG